MGIKQIVKQLLGFYYSRRYNIHAGRGLYVGKDCKIINRGKIQCGDHTCLRPSTHVYLSEGAEVVLGSDCEIGNHSVISAVNRVEIGDGVLTAPNVYIADHNHQYEDIDSHIYTQGVRCRKGDRVEIGRGCWIGKNAVIVGNVRIGRNSVVGANSVVNKDVPDYCVVAGAPAVIVKRYDTVLGRWVKAAGK